MMIEIIRIAAIALDLSLLLVLALFVRKTIKKSKNYGKDRL